MILSRRATRVSLAFAFSILLLFESIPAAQGQDASGIVARDAVIKIPGSTSGRTGGSYPVEKAVTPSSVALYFDPQQGSSALEVARRALESNGELAAARLDIERARARLRQAGLRPNPTVDFEQTAGKLTGSAGEIETSVGVSLPIELGGKRRRRIELAEAELEAVQAEVAERERRLTSDVLNLYAEALAALRELDITEGMTSLDLKTVVFVQARVNEGETAPLELNLLHAEVERLRSKRALAEGRLQSALIRLKSLAGIPPDEPLRLREDISTASLLREPPASLEAAIDVALRTRPDLRFARLTEEVAQAGFRLARAQATPGLTAFTKYTLSRSAFDDTPIGTLRDQDKLLTFGVSVEVPVFSRNQGAKEEAATAIVQARRRREFAEASVRAEVASAYARYEAARAALFTFEQGVINRSNENIKIIRAVYELGEIRITDLISEQRRLLESQREYTEALTERYRALADLHAAIGTPVANSNPPQ